MHFDPTLFFAILAGILLLVGLVGTVLPVLPGPPIAWAGLLAAHFSTYSKIEIWILIATGIAAALITVIDNIFPSLMTKKAGGSKAATWGCTIGLLASFFLGPIFILIAPFIGAFIGEMIHDSSDSKRALKAAFGAFKGFLLGTGLKMITVICFIWLFLWSIFWR
ncbi:MAG: DUF456 domain-containing protein [Treponema sp.]|uniref:DUF456 domain-containing protein n=1 Tax=Treponema sp. TaxID=166 RepID=UPI0025DC8EA9|nr:DUF456 domain-containing protein [Treponema sp.]MBQ9623135.1 DUF456 domain-containing protein [Treponema sp.]MBR0496777.1 DUF456 domain-containing protein [Treponema sp.]